MKKIGLIIIMLLLTACNSHMAYPVMAKDSASDQQRKTDALQCKMLTADFKSKMLTTSPSFGAVGMIRHKKEVNEATEAANQFYIDCMEERGYKLQ